MTRPHLIAGIAFAASFALAEDLALPQQGPVPVREDAGLLRPSVVIKAPAGGPITVPALKPDEAQELAILEMERQLIEDQVRRQIASANTAGNASALKQLIVMGGPMDAAVSRAAKPPTVPEGRVTLIGMEKDAVVSKSLEHFFGVPMTPDREKQLLDTVKTQLAGKDKPKVEVRISGWWPDEGVMTVSVVTKG